MIKRGKGSFNWTIEDKDGKEYILTIEYRGYSDPGRVSGPPEDCYPPEGEIEILSITGAPDDVIYALTDTQLDAIDERAFEDLDTAYRERE